jgi:UPF0716 protein FxsA
MFVLLMLIIWPIAELFVAIEVAQAIGVLATVLLLVIGWPIGLWVVRTQGRAAWQRLSAAVAAGRPPGREVIDGALVLIGGTLLIVPGFITDVIGLVLLAPPTRALARSGIRRNFRSRIVVQATRFARPSSTYDVDSTATDIDPPPLPR